MIPKDVYDSIEKLREISQKEGRCYLIAIAPDLAILSQGNNPLRGTLIDLADGLKYQIKKGEQEVRHGKNEREVSIQDVSETRKEDE
jgi:hypothetical protein